MATVRHKCFISYHHDDQEAVNQFVHDFDHNINCFLARGLGEEMTSDIINSTDTDYVMSQIRKRFLSDSTVTIVLLGKCTWARRYVDWEIQSSLRCGKTTTPNGLLGIKLPSFSRFPARFNDNLLSEPSNVDCYACWMDYPTTMEDLVCGIETAYQRRSYPRLITNSHDRMDYNRKCL